MDDTKSDSLGVDALVEPYRTIIDFAKLAGLKPQLAYKVSDVVEFVGVSSSTLYREHDAGRLRFKKLAGGTSLITVKDLAEWMEADDALQAGREGRRLVAHP